MRTRGSSRAAIDHAGGGQLHLDVAHPGADLQHGGGGYEGQRLGAAELALASAQREVGQQGEWAAEQVWGQVLTACVRPARCCC